jgi:hypothetical protein
MYKLTEKQYTDTGSERYDAHDDNKENAGSEFAPLRFREYPAKDALKKRDQLAVAQDEMRPPDGVADDEVQYEADGKRNE